MAGGAPEQRLDVSRSDEADSHLYPPTSQTPLLSPSPVPIPVAFSFLDDVTAGCTVALINVPLSISLSVASQSTPTAGIICAVWSGLICCLAGGSSFNITGPTGALAGILTQAALRFGADCLPFLAVGSAAISAVVFACRLDRYVHFLPSAVVHGFTLGVALIIMGGQLSNGLGLQHLPVHPHFYRNLGELLTHLQATSPQSLALFALSWVALFALVRRYPKIPWSVPVAALGIGVGLLSATGRGLRFVTLGDQFGALSATLWAPPSLSSPAAAAMWASPGEAAAFCLSIAFVSVLESLISGKLADALTHTEMDSRREVLGLALANLGSGLAGGVPATAALARTALSIRSGAATRVAGVVSAAATAALALWLLPVFAYLPLCVVAALLFQVGVGMMANDHLRDAWEVDLPSFWLTLLVAALCLLFDPTVGIVGGAIVGLFMQAMEATRGYSEVILSDDPGGARHGEPDSVVALYRVVGDLNYLSAATHTARLSRLRRCRYLVLSFRYCAHMDVDGLHQLREKVRALGSEHGGPRLLLCAVPPHLQPPLCRSDWYLAMLKEGRVYPSVHQAIDALQFYVSQEDLDSLRRNVLEETTAAYNRPSLISHT